MGILTAGPVAAIAGRRADDLASSSRSSPVILNVVPGLQFTGAAEATGLLLLALMVGFVAESVFRGLMLTALRERGVWRAIIVTSVLFGLTHLANVLAGATVLETISQVAYTIAFGVAFAALVLRTGIIGPLVLAHAAIDAAYSSRCPASRSPRPGGCIPSTVRASAGWTLGRSLERRYRDVEGFSTEP